MRDTSGLVNIDVRMPAEKPEGQVIPIHEDEANEDDFETADEILERALAEAALNPSSPPSPVVLPATQSENCSSIDPDADEAEVAWPTLPTHSLPQEDDMDADAQSRLDKLMGLSAVSNVLPSVPTGRPGVQSAGETSKRQAGQGWSIPGYKDDNDDDPDTWCCEL